MQSELRSDVALGQKSKPLESWLFRSLREFELKKLHRIMF